jgi:hypothetical protein
MALGRADGAATGEPLPAYGERGARLLVDLTDREAVWAVLDADGRR